MSFIKTLSYIKHTFFARLLAKVCSGEYGTENKVDYK
jgi:hypothetical protein